MVRDAWIVDAVRTPVGRHGGGLATVRPDDLAAHVIRSLLDRVEVAGDAIDEVVLGCANQAGEDNRNVARMALLLAGLPDSVPGLTVNRLCASGLDAVWQACRAVRLGEADLVVAGGVESMSRAPFVMPKPARAYATGATTLYDTSLGWRFPNPKLQARFPLEAMGETAENLVEHYEISREEQDRFAFQSHQRALAAMGAGRFDAEIIPVEAPGPRRSTVVIERDEGPREDTSLDKLARLRPVFREGGSVTAGNSSTLNDGASAVLVASEEALRDHGLRPRARFVAAAAAGVDPRCMGIGPVPATRTALERAGLSAGDIDLVELNEAFAAQSLAVLRELPFPPETVNVNGGAIALGHPLGASGARILTTLLHEMRRRAVRRGLATLCVGVGQGLSMIVESAG